jgi:hypothetical protein
VTGRSVGADADEAADAMPLDALVLQLRIARDQAITTARTCDVALAMLGAGLRRDSVPADPPPRRAFNRPTTPDDPALEAEALQRLADAARQQHPDGPLPVVTDPARAALTTASER